MSWWILGAVLFLVGSVPFALFVAAVIALGNGPGDDFEDRRDG